MLIGTPKHGETWVVTMACGEHEHLDYAMKPFEWSEPSQPCSVCRYERWSGGHVSKAHQIVEDYLRAFGITDVIEVRAAAIVKALRELEGPVFDAAVDRAYQAGFMAGQGQKT